MLNKKTFQQKSAMFGLDARIALAIFGALSVISGAALYSTFEKVETIKSVTEFQEIGKAWEQYYIDTRKQLTRNNTSTTNHEYYRLHSIDLIQKPSSVKNWKGPYLPYDPAGTISFYNSENFFTVIYELTTNETWGGGTVYWHTDGGPCFSGRPCGLWMSLTRDAMDTDYSSRLDKYIDNSDGASKGNFRWHKHYNSNAYLYFYKYMNIRNPNS